MYYGAISEEKKAELIAFTKNKTNDVLDAFKSNDVFKKYFRFPAGSSHSFFGFERSFSLNSEEIDYFKVETSIFKKNNKYFFSVKVWCGDSFRSGNSFRSYTSIDNNNFSKFVEKIIVKSVGMVNESLAISEARKARVKKFNEKSMCLLDVLKENGISNLPINISSEKYYSLYSKSLIDNNGVRFGIEKIEAESVLFSVRMFGNDMEKIDKLVKFMIELSKE